jgi:cellulose synthase/poly-beta-1,6-N-acetylglucosamine synthase-like glycosyltransferase
MDWLSLGQTLFMTVYTIMLIVVSIYGFHRYALVFLYYRHRNNIPKPKGRFESLPTVTIQLPMYNEKHVAGRIIEKTCRIDYPGDKLQIQVLDDSTDETSDIARRTVEKMAARGFDIQYIHRSNREGFKAGALANGLKSAKGEFITIFDADFVPEPWFLKRSIPYFTDEKVCVVQTRWSHLNRDHSMLTRSQAIFLDGHFAIEHVARNRSKRFMAFNGTAGTWRRSAIDDAGGWRHDTLTEDLDLSYRAQLRGWQFVFLPELESPAELPPEMHAFKAQQFRWTKGGAQNAMKLLPKVFLSDLPLKVKVESFFQLTAFCVHLFTLILMILMFPAMYLQTVPVDSGSIWRGVFDMSVLALATFSASIFYVTAQYELSKDWRSTLKYLPVMTALGAGLCVSNTKAVLEAFFGKKSEFVRTPKYGDKADASLEGDRQSGKKKRRSLLPFIEFGFGLYMTVCAVISLINFKSAIGTPFLVIFAFGFYYVSILSFQAQRIGRRKVAAEPDQVAVEEA